MQQLYLVDTKKKVAAAKPEEKEGLPSVKGNYAELLVLTRLLKEGYTVALPYGNQPNWDMLVEVDGHWQKWQVKTGGSVKRPPNSGVYGRSKRVEVQHRSGRGRSLYSAGAFDWLIAVFPATNEMFKTPGKDSCGKWIVSLQSSKYKW